MAITKHLIFCLLALGAGLAEVAFAEQPYSAGLLYDDFHLTLDPGHRTEILGPLYYFEEKETQQTWAIPPLTLAHVNDPAIGYGEFDFAYPFLTYDRFGSQYRWEFLQVFSFAGGKNQDDSDTHRFTLFPLYFQQRSSDPRQNYTAVGPFYGHLDHRLFRDEIDFVMFPLYSKTRKKDVVTYNMPYPFFHLRYGDGLRGWQVWPFVGEEHKVVTTRTNASGETVTIGGHDHRFVMWPFFYNNTNEIGTTNLMYGQALVPFYSYERSPQRDSTSWGWPIGVTHTDDRTKKYDEWDAPWPLVEFAHGEGKTEHRIWPFFNREHNSELVDNWYLWPVYKYNRVTAPPLDRERTRILFFLYSHVNERSTETGRTFKRWDLWPLFTRRRELNGNERLQALAIMEPLFPNNKSIERDYSPLYALWRAEKNPKTSAASQSLLWNLYRRDTAPRTKKISLLFGLFQYQSTSAGTRWRIAFIPVAGSKAQVPAAPSATGDKH